MRRRETGGTTRPGRATLLAGFTVIELMIVTVIIGILIAFILSAAMDGVRRAEERATQALIMKLDVGMTDRLEALLAQSVEPNSAHAYLAASWNNGLPANPNFGGLQAVPANTRAYTLAKIEYMKMELPDVFIVQNIGADQDNYPFNFAASPYAASALTPATAWANHAGYMLPMGTGYIDNPAANTLGATRPGFQPVTTGIYGASYSAAAGLLKQLYDAALLADPTAAASPPTPANSGFDGVDNDNDGLIDEIGENGQPMANAMYALLGNHTHKTARAEMLYALLVEGQGPLGSAFIPDDFRDNEVKDTDGDGLLEFVDAWGEPIQYYRWPIFYVSDSQRGYQRYTSTAVGSSIESRDQNPLDPNQQLMAPAWWGGSFNSDSPFGATATVAGGSWSGSALSVQQMFGSLTDPNAHPSLGASQGQLWDRGPLAASNPNYPRRAFYSKFLILSGGPDRVPGVPVFDPTTMAALDELSDYTMGTGPSIGPYVTVSPLVIRDLRIESQAAPLSPIRTDPFLTVIGADPFLAPLADAAGDDISSHNIQAPGGATQ